MRYIEGIKKHKDDINIVIAASGSLGDIKPFAAIGKILLSQGFNVTIITDEQHIRDLSYYFTNLISVEKLQRKYKFFEPLKTVYKKGPNDIEESIRGTILKFEEIYIKPIYSVYRYICDNYSRNNTLLIGHFLSFGARLANEVKRIPMVVVSLSPYWFTIINDNYFCQSINAIRKYLGLQPISSIMRRWMLTENSVIGLFPEWFVKSTEKLSNNCKTFGFLYDTVDAKTCLDHDISDFVSSNNGCIVFRISSFRLNSGNFFHVAQKVCTKLSMRALFITQYKDMLPEILSPFVRCYKYVPFELLLNKVRLIVHDGGIGTCAEAIRAGIPQLICPRTHEQKDNAERLKMLGLCSILNFNSLDEKSMAKKIEELLRPEVSAVCKHYADIVQRDKSAANHICEEILRIIDTCFAAPDEKNMFEAGKWSNTAL